MDTNNYQTVVARQAIFNRDLSIYAYELLYRGELRTENQLLAGATGDYATSQVINNAFLDFGIEKVVGKHIAFLNMTRGFLIKDEPLPFTHNQVVLEILEDVVADSEVISAVKSLVEKGYKIALDDFVFRESLWPLIKLADIIKIDILALDTKQLEQHVSLLKQENVQLLAEKVESHHQFEQCKALGFDYFQGFFFSKPSLIRDTPLPGSQLHILNLIAKLQDPNTDFDEIEELISHDVSMSYKLLKLLNSAAFALPQKIDSIKQGLVILGFDAIKSWTTLIALHSANPTTPELLTLTLIRAKMCEIVASYFNSDPNTAFTVGLFSTLEAMLLHPMEELLKALPLTTPIKQAVSNQQGKLGQMLKIVMLCERGLWDNINGSPVSIADLGKAYLNATKWTIDIQTAL